MELVRVSIHPDLVGRERYSFGQRLAAVVAEVLNHKDSPLKGEEVEVAFSELRPQDDSWGRELYVDLVATHSPLRQATLDSMTDRLTEAVAWLVPTGYSFGLRLDLSRAKWRACAGRREPVVASVADTTAKHPLIGDDRDAAIASVRHDG